MSPFIQLQVLIIDPSESSVHELCERLADYKHVGHHHFVGNIIKVGDINAAEAAFDHDQINCVFIDPIAIGLEVASSFIFRTRQISPSVVFVLYCNSDEVEKHKALFYGGERIRFHHYFKLNKKSTGEKLENKLLHVVHLCMSDIRLQNSLAYKMVYEERKRGTPAPPIEITDSLARFKLRYSKKKTAFIIMSFEKTRLHNHISKAIKTSLKRFNIVAMRADDFEFHENVYDNILTYMFGCDFGIAVVERISKDNFNPNIAFEIGYMKGLKKPVCILKEKTTATMQADLLGKLYREFDAQSVIPTIDASLNKWVGDLLAKK